MITTEMSGVVRRALVLSLVGLLSVPGVSLAQSGGGRRAGVIVRVVPGQSVGAVVQGHNLDVAGSIASRGVYLLELRGQGSTTQALAALRSDSRVLWAELNQSSVAPEGATQSFFFNVAPAAYEAQYAQGTLGLNAAQAQATGDGVLVAVLDTGVAPTHPLLAGRVLSIGQNFVNLGAPTNDTGNGVDDDGDGTIDEMVGHGTFVAGLIVTVAPDAMILPITVLNSDGVGSAFSVSKGIYHAIDSGAHVINLSFVADEASLSITEAIARARELGIVIVASVGNQSKEVAVHPAANPDVLAVAATDAQDLRAGYSDVGSYVDLCAPGTDIVSSWNGAYASSSGASFAAALVSGAAALVRGLDMSLPVEGVEGILIGTSLGIDGLNPGYEGLLGAGRVRPDAAVAAMASSAAAEGVCDVNDDGVATSADVSAYFALWLAQDAGADLNSDSVVDGLDIDLYLDAWLGCAGG